MQNKATECAELIKSKKLTVSAAESCTGGLIASEFISKSGSSEYFLEGCVTYTVAAKISRLGVKQKTVDTYTVVSPEVAAEMAEGIRNNLHTDIGISTTGYAGPGGGDDKNPVGTVYIGLSIQNRPTITRRLQLSGERNEIRENAKNLAFEFLYEELGKL